MAYNSRNYFNIWGKDKQNRNLLINLQKMSNLSAKKPKRVYDIRIFGVILAIFMKRRSLSHAHSYTFPRLRWYRVKRIRSHVCWDMTHFDNSHQHHHHHYDAQRRQKCQLATGKCDSAGTLSIREI